MVRMANGPKHTNELIDRILFLFLALLHNTGINLVIIFENTIDVRGLLLANCKKNNQIPIYKWEEQIAYLFNIKLSFKSIVRLLFLFNEDYSENTYTIHTIIDRFTWREGHSSLRHHVQKYKTTRIMRDFLCRHCFLHGLSKFCVLIVLLCT